jgi:hypothetical protein
MAPLRTTPASRPAGWIRAMFFKVLGIVYGQADENKKTPMQLMIIDMPELLRKKLTAEAMITPIRLMNSKLPKLVGSFLVVQP